MRFVWDEVNSAKGAYLPHLKSIFREYKAVGRDILFPARQNVCLLQVEVHWLDALIVLGTLFAMG